MRKIKEVLRLRYELKLDQRQIARSCSISVSTVHEYLKRAEAAKVSWPLPDGWDDARLEAALFPCPETKPQPKKSPPDFAAVHEQLRTHRHVTLQLLWEEYREANPDGYGYSRFCELYQRWRKKLDVVMRQEHKAGRESLRRLGRLDDSDLRPRHRRGLASVPVRRRARRQHLHLGRSHPRPADGSLAACAHACLRVFRRRASAGWFPTTPRRA